jgi:hypothetical protein
MRGANEGSSFCLNDPDNAVEKSLVSILLEHGSPSILVEIDGIARILILDTSLRIPILQPGVSRGGVRVTSAKSCRVTGNFLEKGGQRSVSLTMNVREYSHTFLVCSLSADAADLLGADFLEKAGAVIDFECRTMSRADVDKVSRAHCTHDIR